MAGGEGRICDACGESFRTLTRLRMHEKDDCTGRTTYDEIDPDDPNAGGRGAAGLLTCRSCGSENPNADYGQTMSLAGDDLHMIVEFSCRFCGFGNENRIIMEGIDRSQISQLPPHLQPTEGTRGEK